MSYPTYNTFGNVVDEAADELSVDIDSTSFPGLSRANMEKWANRFCRDFISRVNIKSMESTMAFVTVDDTSLAAAPIAGATTVTISLATGWPSSGLCLIDGVPMSFTRSSVTLTVPALQRAFLSGDRVQLGYALPTDFLRPRSMFVDGCEYVFSKKGNSLNVPWKSLAIYGDFLVLPPATSGNLNALIHYTKQATDTLAAASTMEIMDYFDSYVIFMLVARGHRVMYDLDRAKEYEDQAMREIKLARNFYAKENGSRLNAFIPNF